AIPLYDLKIYSNFIKASLRSSDLAVINQLTLNGPFLLNDQNLILGPDAGAIAGSLGAGNGMIITNGNGELRKKFSFSFAYLFPVGSSANQYSSINLNFTAGTYTPGLSFVGIKVVNKKHPN